MNNIVSTDPIADMLTRVRNAINIRKNEVSMPHSKLKEAVAGILKKSGFIDDVKVTEVSIGKSLTIIINDTNDIARITEIVRLSKPGRRYYVNSSEIPIVKRGRGVVIISTSKGLMTGA